MIASEANNLLIAYRSNSNQITLSYLNQSKEVIVTLSDLKDFKFGINHVTQLSASELLLSTYDKSKVLNSDELVPSDLKYFILEIPNNVEFNLNELNSNLKLYSIDKNVLGYSDDLTLHQVCLKQENKSSSDSTMPIVFKDMSEQQPLIIPSIFNHLIALPSKQKNTSLNSYFCRREMPLTNNKYEKESAFTNFKVKHLMPMLKSIVNNETNQIMTQITKRAAPKILSSTSEGENKAFVPPPTCLGYIELIDFDQKAIRYIEVPKPSDANSSNNSWSSYTHLSVINECEFLLDTSPTKSGNFYTLDFYGNLSEWETSTMRLKRSLDDWKKIIMDKQSKELSIKVFNESPNKEMKDFEIKHGKVDEKNAPHVGVILS